jgi:ABC-2 type transport system permease protein
MSTLVVHSALLTRRSLLAMWRQPAYVVVTLVQPVIWLLLFGALFTKVVDIPGFSAPGTSYVDFLTPGVVMMTALFSATWAGTVYIEDMRVGIMDRLLASPVSRSAMMNGTLAYQSVVTVLQSLAVFAIGYAAGARFDHGWPGLAFTLLAAVLLTVFFAAVSNATALLVRQQEALIGISQLVSLPLAFLSSAVMDLSLAPQWVQDVARYNPLNWAVEVSRTALSATPDWGVVWSRLGALAVIAVLMSWAASRAFGAYQKSV